MSKLKTNSGDNSVVIIKPKAYYNMLVHVLRYGSKTKSRRAFKEVMGVLIGHLKEGNQPIKDVVIEKAVPISHGGSIEVSFAPEDYAAFAMVDEKYAERNWFSVGWYHSHPNLGIFFSTTDIINQVGWQTPNPSAIGLVFDHAYLEKENDLGFRTFRLENPGKGASSNYYEVKTIVEPPDSIEYYFKLINLIKSIQTKEPPISEINESPDLFADLEDITKQQVLVERIELDSKEIISSLKSGISELLDVLIEPIFIELNQSISKFTKNYEIYSLNSLTNLVDLKQSISNGLRETQKFLKTNLNDKITGMEYLFEDQLEVFSQDLSDLRIKLDGNIESIKVNLKSILDENISKPTEVITSKLGLLIDDLNNNLNILNSFSQEIRRSINNEKDFQIRFEEFQKTVKEKVHSNFEILAKQIYDRVDSYESKVKNKSDLLNKLNTEIDQSLSDFEKIKANIIKELQDSKTEIKTLKNKIKDLENENQHFLKKIKKLEKLGV